MSVDLLEQNLYVAFREGKETAFEMIFKTYYQPLCRYAYSFTNDPDEAEEIVQSSFLSVWEKRKEITIQTSLKAYLYRTVRNASLNHLKRTNVRLRHAAAEQAAGEPRRDAVSETVATAELEQKIFQAMKALPEQCRIVFQLSRFEELRYQEIADQLNISVKTVENQIGKALKVMRGQLKDYLPLLLFMLKDLI